MIASWTMVLIDGLALSFDGIDVDAFKYSDLCWIC